MKTIINDLKQGFFGKKYFAPRMITVILAVLMMGFSISWLVLIDMGTDPCSLMNIAISDRLGMTLGSWQAMFNAGLTVIVILCGAKNIGFGTIANMLLVGYSIDFFSWIWSKVLPEGLFDSMGVRIAALVPALVLFVLALAVYVDMDMGTSPYDAFPAIIAGWLPKVPFRIVRIAYDGIITLIGFLFGGIPGIVTLIMVFAMGPVMSWVAEIIKKRWDFSNDGVSLFVDV